MTMKVVFRTDASLDIGTGHVMRCLTLAEALRGEGGVCHFICREHAGHLIELIRKRGYDVYALPLQPAEESQDIPETFPKLAHASWLGTSQEEDALSCTTILRKIRPDWLIVDHYAIDRRWEAAQRPYCGKIMVIDDLADRSHDCDLLLDQTFGREPKDYQSLVPELCTILCGSQYALLRPEFAQWRSYSLARRKKPELRHLLITMGGVDRDNATGRILDSLTPDCLPDNCRISVVMGQNAPWLEQIRQQAAQLPWPTSVFAGVTNMARLMADSDLAIGSAGATSWERCCLGLPTLLLVLAENQRTVARNLENIRAVRIMSEDVVTTESRIVRHLSDLRDICALEAMIHAAERVADGKGATRIISKLINRDHAVN